MSDSQEPESVNLEEASEELPSIGYLVSNKKFWIMNILSFGLYSIYWAYKNFLILEVAKPKRPRLFAATHAVFFCITFYKLMSLLENAASKENADAKMPKMLLALLYFFVPILLAVFSKFSSDFSWLDIFQLLIEILILFQLQRKIVQVNATLRPTLKQIKNYGRKEIVICILGISFALLLAAIPFIPADQTFEYKRWHFVDKTNSEMWGEKLLKTEEMKGFWSRFAEKQRRMRIAKNKLLLPFAKAWLEEELPLVAPNIVWDLRVDPTDPSTSILVLTSPFHWGNRPMIEEMISLAPKIEGWKFMSSAPRAPLDKVAELFEQKKYGKLKNFSIECIQSKEHLINIIYKESDLKDPGTADSRRRAIALIDLLVGQDNEDQWIGWLDTEKSDKVLDKEEASKKFIADFNELKEKLLKERFDKPIAQMSEEEKQNAYDTLYDACSTYPFDSRRFSKFNEKFCYFTVKKENTFKTPEAIQNTINELDQALRAEGCACALGGAFDKEDRFYFDLCVTDIDETAKVLQKFARKNKYGKEAWLEFYDDIWISEWIGMEQDSTVPEMRNPDRLPK